MLSIIAAGFVASVLLGIFSSLFAELQARKTSIQD